ncbi:MAG: zinc ribbon domain-containing protein [Melioribacteraceae bacterium]
MKCNKCDFDNNIENNFCINCGNRLDKNEHSEEIICEFCGAVNELTNNYCTSCGENLKSPSSKNLEESSANQQLRYSKPHNKKKIKHYNVINNQHRLTSQKHLLEKKLNFKPLLVSIVIFIISYLVYVIIDSQLDKKNLYEQKVFEVKSSNPAVETQVYEIASKFACSCGTCGEESLEKCTCPRAIEERQFIRDYVVTNQKREDILLAVANKYGFLKSQYASEVKGIDKSKIFEPKRLIKPEMLY